MKVTLPLLAVLCWFWAAPAAAMQAELALGNITHAAFIARDVRVRLDVLRQGEADIRIARLKVGQTEIRKLRLRCSGFYYDGTRMACPSGKLHWDDAKDSAHPLPLSLEWRANGGLKLALKDVDVQALLPLAPDLQAWNPSGRIDLRLRFQGREAHLDLAPRDFSFTRPDGKLAGKHMDFSVVAEATRTRSGWHWRARSDWPEGEFRFAPWRSSAGMQIDAEGDLSTARFDVRRARLSVDGVGAVTASLGWDRAQGQATEWGLVSERIDLAGAMDAWLQPWFAEIGFPPWQATGKVLFAAEWRDGALRRFFAGLENAALSDPTGLIALSGIHANLPWVRDASTEAEVRVLSGRVGDLPLGDFVLPLRLTGTSASVENLVAPMLDGRFVIERLHLEKAGKDWRAEFSGGIENVSMPSLARTLKLPRMEGQINVRIPRIAYENRLLQLDGALAIEVFDGGIIVHQMRMRDPFSANRRLLADVFGKNLDLGMLTRTYAFGSIEGRFDIQLSDLELVGWQPVRFDARIASSEGEHLRLLSLGALKDITTLGKDGEGKVVRGLPERSIGGFGYSAIGVGCVLADGICHLSGIAGQDEEDRVQIMAGSGFPSINIYGYNRHVDWDALVARFRQFVVGRPDFHVE